MKTWFFLIVTIAFVSLPTLAESQAKKDRGGSCSKLCTDSGVDVVSDTRLLSDRSLSDDKRSELCSEHNSDEPGNVYWCDKECKGEGGTFTKLFNKDRKKHVEEFLKHRKDTCKIVRDQLEAHH